MEAGTGDYDRGLRLLTAAKRVVAIAKRLDDDEAANLRRVADEMTERGLGLVVRGARELEAALKRQSASVEVRTGGSAE